MTTTKDMPCVWCGRPEADHGTPGDNDYARAMLAETGADHWTRARPCPAPGVTSQFYTSPHQLVGDKWQGCVCLDQSFGDEGDLLSVYAEQEEKRKPGCSLRIVNGGCNFVAVGLTPEQLDRLAEFLTEAADMIRHCS